MPLAIGLAVLTFGVGLLAGVLRGGGGDGSGGSSADKEVAQLRTSLARAERTASEAQERNVALRKQLMNRHDEVARQLAERNDALRKHLTERSEVVRKVWVYIKQHNLQNPDNGREIIADDKLQAVFGKQQVTMFEMNKHLSEHLK